MSDFLWVEKYRPKTIEECILPANTKKTFSSFLKKGEVPNLLLAGPAGCGSIHCLSDGWCKTQSHHH